MHELPDPTRRPPQAYGPLPSALLDFELDAPVALDRAALLTNLRRARKGSAPGPRECTAEMDDEEATLVFVDVATLLARAQVPPQVVAAIALGRMIAVRKPSGGSRGLVVGVVARTLAQQFSQQLDSACRPHQYALSTRTGAEALVHTKTRAKKKPRLTPTSRFSQLTSRQPMTPLAGSPC